MGMFDKRNMAEKVLEENNGDFSIYYTKVTEGFTPGLAFFSALPNADQYMLRFGGQINKLMAVTDPNSPIIRETDEWLDAQWADMPEDHPLNKFI